MRGPKRRFLSLIFAIVILITGTTGEFPIISKSTNTLAADQELFSQVSAKVNNEYDLEAAYGRPNAPTVSENTGNPESIFNDEYAQTYGEIQQEPYQYKTSGNTGEGGQAIVLLLDCSSSMNSYSLGQTRMDALKLAASAFCRKITQENPKNLIKIITFASSVKVSSSFTNNISVLDKSIKEMRASGVTRMDLALESAARSFSEIKGLMVKNVLVMTDGEPTNSGGYNTEAAKNAALSNGVFLKKTAGIFTLGLFNGMDAGDKASAVSFLKKLQNMGYYEVNSLDKLIEEFLKLAQVILEPVKISLSPKLLSTTSSTFTYQITAKIANQNKNAQITAVSANIKLPSSGSLASGETFQKTLPSLKAGKSGTVTWKILIKRSYFKDDGVFSYTVSAGASNTLVLSRKGTIKIAGQQKNSKELDFSKDIWNFQNFRKVPCPFTSKDWQSLLYELSPSERDWVNSYKTSIGNGYCYGMSVSVILNKMGILKDSRVTSYSNLRKVPKNNNTISLLGYYHFTQLLSVPNSVVQGFMRLTPKEQLRKIEDSVSKVKNSGSPVLIDFGVYGWGAHAVVGYALETGDFTSRSSHKKYNRRVLLYDCNAVDFSEDYCLLFNEGTSQWEIPAYYTSGAHSSNSGAYLKRCTNNLKEIDVKNMEENVYNYQEELTVNTRTSLVLRQMDSGKTWRIRGNSGVDGDGIISYYAYDSDLSSGSQLPPLNIVLPDNGPVSISTQSGSPEEISIQGHTQDSYQSVQSKAATQVVFGAKNQVSLEGNSSAFQIKVTDDKTTSGQFHTYEVSGSNKGTISLQPSGNSLIIKGTNLKGMKVKASNNAASVSKTIPASVKSVKVVKEKNNIQFYQDTNGNGKYNTVVKDEVTIRLNKTALTLEKGKSYTLKATVTPAKYVSGLTWSTSNKKAVTVTSKGVIKAVGAGSSVITVKGANGSQAKCTVKVSIPAKKIVLNKKTVTIREEATLGLKATLTPTNSTDKVVWSSSNAAIASIDKKGLITAHKAGTVTITAKANNRVKAACKCVVKSKPELSIKTDKDFYTCTFGKDILINAEIQLDKTLVRGNNQYVLFFAVQSTWNWKQLGLYTIDGSYFLQDKDENTAVIKNCKVTDNIAKITLQVDSNTLSLGRKSFVLAILPYDKPTMGRKLLSKEFTVEIVQ